jgi:hypothetical protein
MVKKVPQVQEKSLLLMQGLIDEGLDNGHGGRNYVPLDICQALKF